MTTRVPFPFITGGMDDVSRREVERNFQFITDQLAVVTTGWDAMVDPTATADNSSTLVFTTPFRAISYLYTTKGLRSMSIGVISRDGATMTETFGLSAIANASIRIGVVGWQASRTAGSHTVSWNLATFTFVGSGTTINVSGLTLKGGNTGAFTFQNPQFYAANCQVGDATNQRWHSAGTYYDCTYNGSADGIFFNCGLMNFTSGITSGTATQFAVFGGYIQSSGGVSISLAADNVYINATGLGSSAGSAASDTFVIPSARSVYFLLHNMGADGSGLLTVPPALNITSTVLRRVYVEGLLTGLVIPAFALPNIGSCTVRADLYGYSVPGAVQGFDITGPAQLDVNATSQIAAAGGGVVVLRGTGFTGQLNFTNVETANALTLLKAIGVKRSALMVATKRDTGSGVTTGTVPYNFDATSANNVVIYENDGFGGAPVNASATTLIITDTGIPGAPSGPAGGSLAGTFPNPTFAGRFASVAEIDKDFTKHFLMGTL